MLVVGGVAVGLVMVPENDQKGLGLDVLVKSWLHESIYLELWGIGHVV